MNTSHAKKAIKLLGGNTEAARRLNQHKARKEKNLTAATVDNWKRRGVPAKWCIPIERELNGSVNRSEMRPDIYPPEEYAA